MTKNDRRKTLIFLSLVILTTLALAGGLPRLVLQPGQPLPSLANGQFVTPLSQDEPPLSISVNLFFEVMLALLLAGSLLFMIIRIIMGIAWSEYRSLILKTALILIGISFVLVILMSILSTRATVPDVVLLPPTPEPQMKTPLGSAPSWLLWIVGFVFLLLASGAGVWTFETFGKKPKPFDMLILEAEKARRALLDGENIKNVIVRCYQHMSLALKLEQGVEREDFMTPREFERELENLGLPHDPIQQLTQLFEAVRYGNWQATPGDEQKALNCLDAIVSSSRELKKDH